MSPILSVLRLQPCVPARDEASACRDPLADVHDQAAVAGVVAGADVVLSTLGVPFTRGPLDTYSVGTRNIVAAMHRANVRRLVVVSSTGAYPMPGRTGPPFALRLVEPIITKTIGKTVYDDIRRMETVVRGSGLDWTIVRPSGLFDLDDTTDYFAGELSPVGAFTARIDLADYLVKLPTDTTTAEARGSSSPRPGTLRRSSR